MAITCPRVFIGCSFLFFWVRTSRISITPAAVSEQSELERCNVMLDPLVARSYLWICNKGESDRASGFALEPAAGARFRQQAISRSLAPVSIDLTSRIDLKALFEDKNLGTEQ